jgi:hypothetical protein
MSGASVVVGGTSWRFGREDGLVWLVWLVGPSHVVGAAMLSSGGSGEDHEANSGSGIGP